MGQLIDLAKYRAPTPRWIMKDGILLTHPLPKGFNAELARMLGVEECDPAIGHAAALRRSFGIRVEDLAAVFVEIGKLFGDEKLCCRAVSRIDGLLDCRSLERADAVARDAWEEDRLLGSTAREALRKCRCILTAKYTEKWRPLDKIMKHVALLVEATRLEKPRKAGTT